MTITPGIGATAQIGELAGALAKAQIEFKSVLKDTKNPYYNSMYADLSSVIGATQGALAKNGLVVIQNPVVDCEAEKAGVTTIIAHSSGQWMSHDLMLPATMKGKDGVLKFDAQSVGSAITYARRYSYQAIIGIAAETDDDGNAASTNGHDSGTKAAAQSVADRKIAEYKAKQKPPAEDESVVLAPWKQGRTALSGMGLPIIRAALTEEEKRDLGIMLDVHNKVVHIPSANAFRFTDACTKHEVAFIWMDSQTQPPKAVIPAFPDDPIIKEAKIIKANPKKANSKPWLSVKWDGKELGCFEVVNKQHMKPLWDLVLANIGKPADFVIKENGKYLNIEGINRLNGHDYAADQTALEAGTLEPEPEFLEPSMEP